MDADFSPAALAAAAGVDPWALARKVTDGRPDDVIDAGLAFRRAGEQAVEVARLGGVADRTTAAKLLQRAAGDGRLTLEQFSDRVGAVCGPRPAKSSWRRPPPDWRRRRRLARR